MTAKKKRSGKISSVEVHPNFVEIELALANDVRIEDLANRYGLSRDSLYRHKNRMTPERKTLLRYRRGESPIDLERLKQGEAESVVARNVVMMAELRHLYTLCIAASDYRTAVRVAGEMRDYNELQAKFVGELITGDRHLHIEFQESPLYRELLALVMAWAARHPDLAAQLAAFIEAKEQDRRAREAVAATLPRMIEGEAHAVAHS